MFIAFTCMLKPDLLVKKSPLFTLIYSLKIPQPMKKCSIVSAGSRPLFGCVTPVFAVEKGPLVNDVTQI